VIGLVADRTVPALLARAAAALEAAGIEAARPEAEWLLASLLGVDRFALYLDPARRLSTPKITRYLGLLWMMLAAVKLTRSRQPEQASHTAAAS